MNLPITVGTFIYVCMYAIKYESKPDLKFYETGTRCDRHVSQIVKSLQIFTPKYRNLWHSELPPEYL